MTGLEVAFIHSETQKVKPFGKFLARALSSEAVTGRSLLSNVTSWEVSLSITTKVSLLSKIAKSESIQEQIFSLPESRENIYIYIFSLPESNWVIVGNSRMHKRANKTMCTIFSTNSVSDNKRNWEIIFPPHWNCINLRFPHSSLILLFIIGSIPERYIADEKLN